MMWKIDTSCKNARPLSVIENLQPLFTASCCSLLLRLRLSSMPNNTTCGGASISSRMPAMKVTA